jgi:predicted transcriptional regulator of viral defense system
MITMDDINEVREIHERQMRRIGAAFEAAGLLQRLQWQAGEANFCQVCFRTEREGHESYCQLADILKRANE